MEENNSKEFIEKIFDLSECLNSTKEETLLNFQNFFTLIQNNENKFKKMIVNRNNDVFKKTKFFNYTDNNIYSDKFWTSLQLCCILYQLNDNIIKDGKFTQSLIKSIEKYNNWNNNNLITTTDNSEKDLNNVKDMLNKINPNDVSNMLNKFGINENIENDKIMEIINNLKNIDVNKSVDKNKIDKINNIIDEFIEIFNKSKINNTDDIIKITNPLIEKYKDFEETNNLSHDEIIIAVMKNKDKLSKIDMAKMMNLVMSMSMKMGGNNQLDILSLINSFNK